MNKVSIMAEWGKLLGFSPWNYNKLDNSNCKKDSLLNTQICLWDPHFETSEGGCIGTNRAGRTGGRTERSSRCSQELGGASEDMAIDEELKCRAWGAEATFPVWVASIHMVNPLKMVEVQQRGVAAAVPKLLLPARKQSHRCAYPLPLKHPPHPPAPPELATAPGCQDTMHTLSSLDGLRSKTLLSWVARVAWALYS